MSEELTTLTIAELAPKLAAGEISPVELTEAYLDRIGRLNDTVHAYVDHSRDKWVNGNVHTNTVENFFSILKRGIDGVYHHVSEVHLHRYLSEFDFRYNLRTTTDGERAAEISKAAEGKRLRLRNPQP